MYPIRIQVPLPLTPLLPTIPQPRVAVMIPKNSWFSSPNYFWLWVCHGYLNAFTLNYMVIIQICTIVISISKYFYASLEAWIWSEDFSFSWSLFASPKSGLWPPIDTPNYGDFLDSLNSPHAVIIKETRALKKTVESVSNLNPEKVQIYVLFPYKLKVKEVEILHCWLKVMIRMERGDQAID